MSYFVGERYTFTKTFLSGSTPTDPTTFIKFHLREEVDGTELEWTYNGSPVAGTHYPVGMNAMGRTSAGIYTVAFDLRKPERVTGFFVGAGTVFDAEQTTVLVRHVEIRAIDDP